MNYLVTYYSFFIGAIITMLAGMAILNLMDIPFQAASYTVGILAGVVGSFTGQIINIIRS
jgi:hypothetical protein